jgi:hypothetical protein
MRPSDSGRTLRPNFLRGSISGKASVIPDEKRPAYVDSVQNLRILMVQFPVLLGRLVSRISASGQRETLRLLSSSGIGHWVSDEIICPRATHFLRSAPNRKIEEAAAPASFFGGSGCCNQRLIPTKLSSRFSCRLEWSLTVSAQAVSGRLLEHRRSIRRPRQFRSAWSHHQPLP